MDSFINIHEKKFELIKLLVDTSIKNFEEQYNQLNPEHKVSLKLSLDILPSFEEEFIKKASIKLVLKYNATSTVLFNKMFAFRNEEEVDNKNDWGFKLYAGAFQELCSVGLTFAILNNTK